MGYTIRSSLSPCSPVPLVHALQHLMVFDIIFLKMISVLRNKCCNLLYKFCNITWHKQRFSLKTVESRKKSSVQQVMENVEKFQTTLKFWEKLGDFVLGQAILKFHQRSEESQEIILCSSKSKLEKNITFYDDYWILVRCCKHMVNIIKKYCIITCIIAIGCT